MLPTSAGNGGGSGVEVVGFALVLALVVAPLVAEVVAVVDVLGLLVVGNVEVVAAVEVAVDEESAASVLSASAGACEPW